MGAVTTSLAERAESIFADLGYTVSRTEGELLAERKWRLVHVTPSSPETVPTAGEFRCFVTPSEDAPSACRRVAAAEPGYEWAVIGVDDDGGYEVFDESIPA